ncbi:MAG: alcohol dehydrogenase catalytic domain-containing protein, partial [Candidatus Gracilibacteria bacterium]|nr:alcohol dehydrogenase catalytic domain-containing protein [Candidatus Gracilibacteria bacterium]
MRGWMPQELDSCGSRRADKFYLLNIFAHTRRTIKTTQGEKIMRQIIMVGPGRSKIVDVPIPEIDDNQLLIKVTLTGICHSELYPWSIAKAGDIFAHESMGVVAKAGKNVTGFKEGDRVTGLGGGGYKEYIVMEPAKTCHVPANLADEDAIAEPLACLLSA